MPVSYTHLSPEINICIHCYSTNSAQTSKTYTDNCTKPWNLFQEKRIYPQYLVPVSYTHLDVYKRQSPQYSVFGTLKEPIHAKNLNQTFKEIYSVCQNPFIIAVDSCLGYAQHVGCITLSPLPLLPGRGVSKQLPPIGQLSITGIVNVFSDSVSNESVIQNTRLHTVIKLADFITNAIKSANIPSIYQVSCPHP